MAQLKGNVFFDEGKISKILESFSEENAIEKNKEFILRLKKKKAVINIALGAVVLALGLGATLYGVADVFGGRKLPMGVLFLIGGPIMAIFSLVFIGKASVRLATASDFSFADSIEELCKQFYDSAFCKAGTDTETRENFLMDGSHLIPPSIWENYQDTGWSIIRGKPKKKKGKSEPIECTECHRKHEHSETMISESLPIRDNDEQADYKKRNTYLHCSHCNLNICYQCMDKMDTKELRFLCPACGKSTNGIDGLSERWEICRQKSSDQDIDFSISQISINQETHNDKRISPIVIHLTGDPFGSIRFRNVAIKTEGGWFLATPEPITC